MKNTCLLIIVLLINSPALKSQDLESIKDTLNQWIDRDGDYEKALPLTLGTAERLKRDSGDHNTAYAEFLYSYVGPLYEQMGNYKLAEQYYKEGMNLSADIAGDSSILFAGASANLGNMYNKTGLQYEARDLTERAYNIFRANPETPESSLAPTINNLAQIYQFLQQYAKALDLYTRLLNIMEKDTADYAPYLPIVYSNIGTLYSNIGAHEKALIYFDKSEADFQKYYGKKSAQYIGIESNIAVLKLYKGDINESINLLSSLDSVLQKLTPQNPPLHILVLGKLGGALYAGKNYKLAQQILLRAADTAIKYQLTKFPFSKNNDLMLANLYMEKGNYSAAENILLASVDSVKTINARLYFGYLMALERLYSNTAQPEKAHIYMRRLNDAATELYDNNFAFLTNDDKLKLLPLLQYALYSEINIMLEQPAMSGKQKNDLFTHCIAMKMRLLQDQKTILNKVRTSDNDSIQHLYSKWLNNRRYLDEQNRKPAEERSPFADSIQADADVMESALVRLLKVEPARFSQLQNVGVREVQAQLKDNEAAIEYIKYRVPDIQHQAYTDKYMVMIVKKGDTVPLIEKLCSEKDISALMPDIGVTTGNDYLNKLYIDSRLRNKNVSYPGDKIYDLLVKPLLPYLKNINTLYCSTDGLINVIALQALPVNTHQMLIDSFNIHYISSCAQLIDKKDDFKKLSKATVWGGINYNISDTSLNSGTTKANWKFLPASKTEAASINDLLKNKNIQSLLYTGDTASKSRFDSLSGKGFNIVHIATHGYFTPLPATRSYQSPFYFVMNTVDENTMLHCGLVLAGANDHVDSAIADKGYADAFEISAMDFSDVYLVTLSACETALGKNVNGEGIFGLSRAFALSGAKNIIVSLWQVPDKETTEFMLLFYTKWLNGSSLHEAFETAQKTMKEKYTPYYWAALKLIEE